MYYIAEIFPALIGGMLTTRHLWPLHLPWRCSDPTLLGHALLNSSITWTNFSPPLCYHFQYVSVFWNRAARISPSLGIHEASMSLSPWIQRLWYHPFQILVARKYNIPCLIHRLDQHTEGSASVITDPNPTSLDQHIGGSTNFVLPGPNPTSLDQHIGGSTNFVLTGPNPTS